MDHTDSLRLRTDGSIDFEYHVERARRERAEYLRKEVGATMAVSPVVKRRAKMFAAAFVVATAAFWTAMLSSPPVTQAEAGPYPTIYDLHKTAAQNLPALQADAN